MKPFSDFHTENYFSLFLLHLIGALLFQRLLQNEQVLVIYHLLPQCYSYIVV